MQVRHLNLVDEELVFDFVTGEDEFAAALVHVNLENQQVHQGLLSHLRSTL